MRSNQRFFKFVNLCLNLFFFCIFLQAGLFAASAITYDNGAPTKVGNGTSLSASVTVPGSNGMIVVGISKSPDSAVAITSITCNGIPMSLNARISTVSILTANYPNA